PEYNIYKAVYALAYALDAVIRCEAGRGPFSGNSCATLETLEPWQLIYYLEKVNFTTSFGDQVSFDENGDALPIYDIMNWQWLPDGRTKVHNVGVVQNLYDNCATFVIGFSAALSLASGREEQFLLKETCLGTPPVLGIIGDSRSTFSMATSDVLGLFRLPIVRAMIQILKHFGWTWAGLLTSDDDYGLHAARSFHSDLGTSGGGCLAYTEILPWGDNPAEIRRIVSVMRKSTARVVIVFAHEDQMIHLMEEVVRQNVTGLQWMASEAWTAAVVLQTPRLMPYLGGTLGIAIRRGEISGLRDFLLRTRPDLHDSNNDGNSLVRAMIQILKHFGWTWAGLLVSDDDYGLHAARSFQSDLGPSGGEAECDSLQWMASEAWTAAAVLQTPRLMPYLGGTLGIAIRRGEIAGLREFLLRTRPDLHDSNNDGNSLVRQFWEYTFQCRFAPAPAGWIEAGGTLCTGDEDLENMKIEFLDVSNLRPEYNIYKAVYALAYALDDVIRCEPGRGPFSGNSCATLETLEPW
ncbi:hypothetical protein INR49_003420, partial [Caranx melampygus]